MKQKQRKYVKWISVILLFAVAGVWYVFHGKWDSEGQSNTKELSGVLVSENVTAEGLQPGSAPDTDEGLKDREQIVVYICGAVAVPDIYAMPAGSRLYEIIKMAGGFTDDADPAYHNLARQLTDGERIYILTQEETKMLTMQQQAEGEEGSEGFRGNTKGQINLNTATAEQLMELPGIGEAKAVSILEYRTKVGKFADIKELMNVSGIGEAMFEKIKDKVVVK